MKEGWEEHRQEAREQLSKEQGRGEVAGSWTTPTSREPPQSPPWCGVSTGHCWEHLQ